MTYQEKRNRNLFFSLLGLSAITLFYFWFSGQEKSVVDADTFQVADLATIDQVLLEKGGETVDLKFDGVRWKINDQLADRDMIDVLFATLQQAKPVRPVAQSLQDSVVNQLQSQGVKVSLFTEGKTELIFQAGGNARKSQAYFLKEDDDVAYIMNIPGYRVYVSGIFELENNGWKDKYVFQLNWRNFQSLHVGFPKTPTDDFDVSFVDTFFSVEGIAAVDTARLNIYLDAVSLLTVDGYSSIDKFPESLKNSAPDMTISIKDVAGKEHSLVLYLNKNKDEPVVGIINATQLAFFDPKKIDPIIKNRNFFQQE